MNDGLGFAKRLFTIFLVCLALAAGGCEGTEPRENVDDAVEEMAGKKNVARYKQMKHDLGEIQTQQEERYHQLDDDGEDK